MNSSSRHESLELIGLIFLYGGFVVSVLCIGLAISEFHGARGAFGRVDPVAIASGLGFVFTAIVAPFSGWATKKLLDCQLDTNRMVANIQYAVGQLPVISAPAGSTAPRSRQATDEGAEERSKRAHKVMLDGGGFMCSSCYKTHTEEQRGRQTCSRCRVEFTPALS